MKNVSLEKPSLRDDTLYRNFDVFPEGSKNLNANVFEETAKGTCAQSRFLSETKIGVRITQKINGFYNPKSSTQLVRNTLAMFF